jgi:hypothetical protein
MDVVNKVRYVNHKQFADLQTIHIRIHYNFTLKVHYKESFTKDGNSRKCVFPRYDVIIEILLYLPSSR